MKYIVSIERNREKSKQKREIKKKEKNDSLLKMIDSIESEKGEFT